MHKISKKSFIFFTIFTNLTLFAHHSQGLINLEKKLTKEFEWIHFPGVPFGSSESSNSSLSQPILDVAIIGGGMAGLAAAGALYKEGIFNVQLFDENSQGLEGPWLTYARMKTLRSKKDEIGPALDIPRLTFQAWYEAQYGKKKWDELDKIPTEVWMKYLSWYRDILQIPVENGCKLLSIDPVDNYFILKFKQNNQLLEVFALKIVLATGRGGFGGPFIPDFAKNLSKKCSAHVMDMIDFKKLKDKKIGIVGRGASAFDTAASALEQGAKKVELLMRAAHLPTINKFPYFHSQCFGLAYYNMSKEWRWNIMNKILTDTVPPPVQSLERVQVYKNFSLNTNMVLKLAKFEENQVVLGTNKGKMTFDFLILATGYSVDGSQQPELSNIIKNVQLWADQKDIDPCASKLKLYPFLGSKFEFLEKVLGQTPYLKNIHCFNHASTLSHGIICRDITHISLGARRLAEGIAADFLENQTEIFLNSLNDIEPDFNIEDYFKK